MRIAFDINLIRNQVPSAAKRRLLHFAMLFYLAAWGAILATIAYQGTHKLMDAFKRHAATTELHQRFTNAHPGMDDELYYLRSLVETTRKNSQTLEEVSTALARGADVGGILLGLAMPLPPKVDLLRVEKIENDRISFDITIPDRLASTVSQASLIAEWNEQTLLDERIHNLRSVSSHRRRVGAESYVVLRFECRIKQE